MASNREFFRVRPEDAAAAILDLRQDIDGIGAWSEHPVVRLRMGDRLLLSMRAGQIFVLLAYPDILASSADIVDFWQAHADGDTLEIYATDHPEHVAGFSDDDPAADEEPVPFLDRVGSARNDMIYGRERLVPGDRLLWMKGHAGDECSSVVIETGCHSQVIGRTRNLQLSPEGFPLLLNFVTAELSPR